MAVRAFLGSGLALSRGLGEKAREDRLGLAGTALRTLDPLAVPLGDGHGQCVLLSAPATTEIISRHGHPLRISDCGFRISD